MNNANEGEQRRNANEGGETLLELLFRYNYFI